MTTSSLSLRTCEACPEDFEAQGQRRLCDGCRRQRRREARKRWKQKNPEKVAAQVKREGDRRRAYQREYQRQLRDSNPELVRERVRQSYRKHQQRRIDDARRYRQENPEKVIAARRRHYRRNRERLIHAAVEASRRKGWNVEQVRERRRLLATAEGSFTQEEFNGLCAAFSWRCAYCGDRPDQLTTDHVVPLSKGGGNSIDNILPACRSCNSSKKDESLEAFLARRRREEGIR